MVCFWVVLLLVHMLQHGSATDTHIMDNDANLDGWRLCNTFDNVLLKPCSPNSSSGCLMQSSFRPKSTINGSECGVMWQMYTSVRALSLDALLFFLAASKTRRIWVNSAQITRCLSTNHEVIYTTNELKAYCCPCTKACAMLRKVRKWGGKKIADEWLARRWRTLHCFEIRRFRTKVLDIISRPKSLTSTLVSSKVFGRLSVLRFSILFILGYNCTSWGLN